MDMGGDTSSGPSCKISMLWNWYTIDACFLSRSWHIHSSGAMAASCIGVMLLTVSLELLRRLGKEYDAFVIRQFHSHAARLPKSSSGSGANGETGVQGPQTLTFRASPLQQLVRAVIHAVTFGVAYIIMLLAMYFNGFIILSIFIGAGIGKFVCDWLVYKVVVGGEEQAGTDNNTHAVEEPTVCCG